ncbi:hypothetical protein [Rathayibacter sp. Leaf248]|uniref:hypothetical protein n=1 Tax=Rathayibacter sp. Leaf248 TaxID=2876555 RepID=UPI001E5B29C6|nr:hypothetical protein [Rathayibacter sp. Leaf248]
MAQNELPFAVRVLTIGALAGATLAGAHAVFVGVLQARSNAANGGDGQGAAGTALFFAVYEIPVAIALGLLVAGAIRAIMRSRRSRKLSR